jgi:hypothetical protein
MIKGIIENLSADVLEGLKIRYRGPIDIETFHDECLKVSFSGKIKGLTDQYTQRVNFSLFHIVL